MKLYSAWNLTVFSCLTLLAACGGGGGASSSTTAPALQISGTAATGAAIASGTVEAKCLAGTGTATTNADGSYTVTVASGVQPCILRATDPITHMQLHSVVEAGATSANITPATDLVVANTVGESPSSAFTNYSATHQQKITATNISTAVTRVQTATAALGTDADMRGVDIMKGNLQAATGDLAGNAADKKIDALMAALAAADKKISELSALLANSTSETTATNQLKSLVGNAQYSLASCPAARSGDIWVLDLLGTAPIGFNVDFNAMLLKNLTDNITSAIYQKRDAQNAVVPCAFTATVNGSTVEFRITDGGIGIWRNANDFGITVPAQRTQSLTDLAFAGSYPAAGFLRERNSNTRGALPFKFIVSANGDLQGYSCDLDKLIPDCTTTLDSSDPSGMTCNPMSNGTLSCSASNGLRATGVLYVTGGQTSMFMAVTQMPMGSYNFGGLIVMTKASAMRLPTAGQTSAAGSSWYVGVNPGSSTVVSGSSTASTVESVNAATNSYITSSQGSTNTYTRYINTPSEGFGYASASDGTRVVGIGSSTGWSMSMVKRSSGLLYDGWFAYARAKR